MPFAAALSGNPDTCRAVNEAASEALTRFGGAAPELGLVFFSPHHEPHAEELAATLASRLTGTCVVGCQGESIVGNRREVENTPAISVWLGGWGGAVAMESFHLQATRTPDGPTLLGWPDLLTEADPKRDLLLLLGDPYSLPTAEMLLPFVNDDCAGLPLVGGMASGMSRPGERVLIRNGEVLSTGAAGVMLRGPLKWRSVVSQGARPIGKPLVVTKGGDNIIQELGGQRPLDYMRGLFGELSEADRGLVRQGLMIGLAMSEYRERFERGDFLIRSLHGFDGDSGALAVGDRVRLGQTVQFQLRDADAADEELRLMLRRAKSAGANPGAGLLFSCNGRGTRMFPAPDHDAQAIQEESGPLPLAGFFAAGELGPVGGRNFIHGFTASVVLFE